VHLRRLFPFLIFSHETRRGRNPRDSRGVSIHEVYGCFGGCVLVGVAFFVLAVLGVAHIGIVIGSAGLIGAVASAYAIVREAQNVRHRCREVGPPGHSDSRSGWKSPPVWPGLLSRSGPAAH